MSNKRIINCPFCNQELDTNNYYVRCHNPRCDTTEEMEGTEELWQELIRTRKALDVAIDGLERILNHATAIDTARCRAEMALKEITALEQRDVK